MPSFKLKYQISGLILLSFLSSGCIQQSKAGRSLDYSEVDPKVIKLDLPAQYKGSGGVITADVNNDNQKDFIITKPNHIAVYNHSGNELWTKKIDIQITKKAEAEGLPGLHAPGIQIADVDGDEKLELLFLTRDNTLHVVRGSNGETKQNISLEVPPGAERWEHLVIANFRGKGDRDLLLQTTNAEGYRMGRYLAAYSLDELRLQENPQPLWTRDDFVANAHNGARVADLNQDGRDEVLGGTIVSPDGKILVEIPLKGHLDSIFVADVRPDIPGLEVVGLEEGGGDRVFLYNHEKLIWETDYKGQEPQNATIGDFDPDRPGLEIWCRSRYNENQKPFVFDAQGEFITSYVFNQLSPNDWTNRGVEVIFSIHWTGDSTPLAAAKERHESGDVAIFNPMTGQFLHRFREKADRLYVADVSGDWREELIVLNGNQLHIYRNPEPNPNPNHSRLWTKDHYRRSKMTWNYYSP